jgi:hypothetical protein
MNCKRFQDRLYEYVEGSLSPARQAAADKHLARCTDCRQALRQEQQLTQFLSERLRQDAETLSLHPEGRQRILTALQHKSAPPMDRQSIIHPWNRLAWPLAVAASLLLIATLLLIKHFSSARAPETKTLQSNGPDIHSAVSIEISCCVPTYEFRREGDLVVDTLSCETIVASGTLGTGGQKPVPQKTERYVPL